MLKKRKRKSIKNKVFLIIVLLCLIGISIHYFISNNSHFKIENRSSEIAKEKKNDDESYKTVGWLRVQGTSMDMPVIVVNDIKGPSIVRENYAWTINRDGKYYNSMRLYGHNIFNLSAKPKISSPNFKRFEELLGFIYHDFAQQNQYIQLSMDNKNYVYKIFAVGIIEYIELDRLPVGEHSKKEMQKEINLFKENSIYDYKIKVDSNDKILSLITCTRMYGRDEDVAIVVSAKLVDNHHIKRLSKVKRNNKYKKIEKALKGDDSDEEVFA